MIKNTITRNSVNVKRRPPKEQPDFELKNRDDNPNYVFGQMFVGDDPARIYIRAGRLSKPVGGKCGAVLIINPFTGKILEAHYCRWGTWERNRNLLKLRPWKRFDYIEITPAKLAKSLGVTI